MISEGYLSTTWSARNEPIEPCADRVAQCLRALRDVSPLFSQWLNVQRKGRLEVSAEAGMLRELLLAGRQRTDFAPRRVIENLGFGLTVMTDDKPGERLTFRVTCGGYSPHVLNQCFIDFAAAGGRSYQAVAMTTKIEALKVLIEAWAPDWGMIGCRRLKAAARAQDGIDLGLSCGEVTFVGAGRPPLPEVIRDIYDVHEVPPYGSLIYATKAEAPEADSHAVKRVVELHKALDRAGVFHRAPALQGRPKTS